ncbi:hypothetical protein OPIT5_27600 [Opitutaceae bacterium TAV5]|nr:hypothetical protein OPIT5_27600 [Opitutaceae bacterium TAV5]
MSDDSVVLLSRRPGMADNAIIMQLCCVVRIAV